MASRIRTVFLQSSGRLRSGWRLALFILLLILTVALLRLILQAAGLRPPHGPSAAPASLRQLPAAAGAVLAMLFASAVLLWAAERRSLSTIGLALRSAALPGALLGLVAGVLPVALAVTIFACLGVASIRGSESIAGMAAPAAVAAVVVTSLVSLLEELLWRGYAFQLLIEGTGRWIAVLATALVWALAHANNPGANVAGVIYLALSGVLIAWLVIRTGSLWPAIGYHVAWNVTAAHVFGLTTSGFDLGASFLRTTLTGPAWLTGGAFGFEASFITEILDILGLATALLLSRYVPRIAEAIPYFERRPAPVIETQPPAFMGEAQLPGDERE